MSKKTLTLLAVVVIIAALAGALLLLNKEPAPEESSASESSSPAPKAAYALGSAERRPVGKIEVQNEYGSFAVLNVVNSPEAVAADYTLEGYEDLPLLISDLYTMSNQAASLSAKTTVTEKAEELSLYGLQSPRATVTVSYLEGEPETLLVGNDAAGNEGTYVKQAGADPVYLVNSSHVSRFLRRDMDFIDTLIYGAVENQEDLYSFQRAELGGTVRETPIVVEETPEDAASAGGMTLNTHGMTAPIEARLNLNNGMETFTSVFGLTAASVEAVLTDPEAQLAEYGLDAPYSTFSLQMPTSVRNVTLLASAPGEDGMVRVLREGVRLVYNVPAASLPWLESTVFSLMDKMAIMPYIEDVAAVTVSTPELSHTFTLTGESDTFAAALDGEPIENTKNFRQFYQSLIAASYTEETEDTIPEGDASILEITYTYRDGSAADTLRFYTAPARKTYMQLNDGTVYLGLSSYVDRIAADLVKIAAGEEVKSYL